MLAAAPGADALLMSLAAQIEDACSAPGDPWLRPPTLVAAR
jgi:hypothetical protein